MNMKSGTLAAIYREKQPKGHFFDMKTLKCWGACLSRMKVDDKLVEHVDCNGNTHLCYRLTSVEVDPDTGTRTTNVFLFDRDTMEDFYVSD